MSSEIAISLQNISKCYRLYSKPQDRLKQMILRGYKQYFTEFWALHDVSFEVEKGACIGILGRNGAGKSTLLQIITGIVAPTSGNLQINGKVAALLELGTGFNPEFTGSENVFLNGSILGLSQDEIQKKYDEIVTFADIGKFIEQPVKTYSSGMMVRLAFAVAINVDPEILIIDEALSVGDAKFQAKCFRKFQDFRDQKKTILFVSHATEQVIRHCDHAVLLENGRVFNQGEPKSVANKYLTLLFDINPIEKESEKIPEQPTHNSTNDKNELQRFIADKTTEDNFQIRPGYNKAEYRWGNSEAVIVDYLLSTSDHWHINHFKSQDLIELYIKIKFNRNVDKPIYGLTIKTPDGVTVYGTNSRDYKIGQKFFSQTKGSLAIVKFYLVPRLVTGHYLLSLGVVEESSDDVIPLDRRYDAIEIYITNDNKSYGIADLEMKFEHQS